MLDKYGRNIDYLRISITDRCNLRCKYCMPDGCGKVAHEDVLSYEEFLRLAGIFAALGFRHFRVTGGEPLVREGAADFVRALKRVPGVEKVTMTTNGLLLTKYGPALAEAGLDGVVCSPLEAAIVKNACGKDFITVTPGIRYPDGNMGDQSRVTTPAKAREAGTEFIVVGRPITQAPDPVAAYRRVVKDFLG